MSKEMTWGMTCLPPLRDLLVHVLPGPGYASVVSLFCDAGAKKAKSHLDADLVVFLGGTDVSPSLYRENPVEEVTHTDPGRDARESTVFQACKTKGVAMMGICRGAQFLHVMNGGKLWQHVDNHTKPHLIYDVEEDLTVVTSSTHHQMMRYDDDIGMNLIAITEEAVATFVKSEEEKLDVDRDAIIEVEACFYSDTKCLCIQGHPEFGPPEFTSWSFHKLHELLTCDWSDETPQETLKALA